MMANVEKLENYIADGWDDELSGLFREINLIDSQSQCLFVPLSSEQVSRGDEISTKEHPALKSAYDTVMDLKAKAQVITSRLANEVSGTEDVCELCHGPEHHLCEINSKWGSLNFAA